MDRRRRKGWHAGVARRTARALHGILPFDRRSDAVIQTLRFLGRHGRLPDRTGYSDILLRRLISPDNRGGIRAAVTDKIEVKAYVADRIGERYVVPTIVAYDSADQIDLAALPDDFCIKPAHMSGAFAFRRNGGPVDLDEVASWFDADYYRMSREGNYAGLRRRVMVEPLIFGRESPWDYKFVCSGGRVRFIHLNLAQRPVPRRVLTDRAFRQLPFGFADGEAVDAPPPPPNLGRMVDLAERLAAEFDFVRVDLYTDGEEIRFGELTNVPFGAMNPVIGPNGERALAEMVFGAGPESRDRGLEAVLPG